MLVFDTNKNQKFTSKIVFLICLCVVVTDAFVFKKDLLLQKPIICLQAFYGLNCFEQTYLYESTDDDRHDLL